MQLVFLHNPVEFTLSYFKAKSLKWRQSVAIACIFSSAFFLGGAAFYFRRKRRKNEPEKPKMPSLKYSEINSSVRKNQANMSASSTSAAYSARSSIRSRSRTTSLVSPADRLNARRLYNQGMEEVQTALHKMEQAASMLESEDSFSDLTLTEDIPRQSSPAMSQTTSLDENLSSTTLVVNSSNETVLQASSDTRSSSSSTTCSTSKSHNKYVPPDKDTVPMEYQQQRIDFNSLGKQIKSITKRMQKLPSLASEFDEQDTLVGSLSTNRDRCFSESSSIFSDTESTTTWHSAQEQWEMRSTEFAMNKTPDKPLDLYREGMTNYHAGKVPYRKLRTEYVKCISDEEYISKLYCLRLGLEDLLSDEVRCKWVVESGKLMMESILCAANRDCTKFSHMYDKMVNFCSDPNNRSGIMEELKNKQVTKFNFFDVVIDLVLLDAFDLLADPPKQLESVIKTKWLSFQLKERAVTSTLWAMLELKRKMRKKNGFYSNLYDVTSTITPDLVWGFFGPDTKLKKACLRFKGEIDMMLEAIFSFRGVRLTSVDQLSEDLMSVMRERFDSFMDFMRREVLRNVETLQTSQ